MNRHRMLVASCLVLVLALLLNVCTAPVAPANNAAAPTAAAEEEAAPEEMTSDIGSEENPIKVLFVPSVDAQVIVSGGELMAEALNEATGLNFEVSVPTSYAATIEEMCASPENSMGFIPGLGYVLANQLCSVDVAFKAVRFGNDAYWAQLLVPRDSDVETLAGSGRQDLGLSRCRFHLRLLGHPAHDR